MKILEALRARRLFGRVPMAMHAERLATPPTDAARPHDVDRISATIENALSAAGLMPSHAARTGEPADARTPPAVDTRWPWQSASSADAQATTKHPGQFVTRTFSNGAGSRQYKLYIPRSCSENAEAPIALVVMLHGCTQSPDDFAAGTRMNELAEEDGFIVVYPEQTAKANGSRCWNWFRSEDQLRDQGEPSLIAGITREVASEFRIADRRVYVAGLSAGAAMAVILGTTYPELYAAVGAHSGLPYAAAHDVPSAFGAMKGAMNAAPAEASVGKSPTPTITFHGDADTTVHASNSEAIVKRATRQNGHAATSVTQRGTSEGGSEFSRTTYTGADGVPFAEAWIVHGAAHAWIGGSANGSFTEPRGPDASKEMIRFFLAQQAIAH